MARLDFAFALLLGFVFHFVVAVAIPVHFLGVVLIAADNETFNANQSHVSNDCVRPFKFMLAKKKKRKKDYRFNNRRNFKDLT